MINPSSWLRIALALFPRDFQKRHAEDLLETAAEVLTNAAPAERSRTRRRLMLQLARAGLAERFSSLAPLRRPAHFSRSSFMDDLFQDLRSALRSLLRRPAFAIMVVVTLGIGLGASAAMFGVVHGVLLRPLPFEHPERLVTVIRTFTNDPSREAENMSLPDLRDVQTEAESLEAVAGYGRRRATLIEDGEPRLIDTCYVTDGLLRVFGLAPSLGRDLTREDAVLNAPSVAVLGFDFWRTHFGGDPNILGRTVELSGESFSVVGVAPQDFDFPRKSGAKIDAWVAAQIDTEDCGRGCHLLDTVGRLAEGSDPVSATRELEVLGAALEANYPEWNTHKRFAVRQIQEQEVAPVQSALWLLLGAVQLVVLIAAANVANLVLVRGTRRRRELAIRTAIGAGRGRLFRQLMLENALLAAGGAVLGLLVGQAALTLFLKLAPSDLPRLDTVALDGPVFAFTAVLSFVVLLIFGLVPAARMARTELRERSGTGNLEGKRSRVVLLTAEVALALMLLLGAGLLLRSFARLTEIDLGFAPERVTRFVLTLPDADYPEPENAVAFSEQLEEGLRTTPGVEAAGLALAGPFGENQVSSMLQPLDRPKPPPGEELPATFDVVSTGFFETLQIPALEGRLFEQTDTRSAPPVLVISRSLAERYYPGKDPIGEQALIGVSFGFDNDDTPFTIVGVVPDIHAYSLQAEPAPAVYIPQAQTGSQYLSGLVRARAGVDVVSAVTAQVKALDPKLPIRSVKTQASAIDEAFGPQRFYLALLTSFAAVALLLSAIGLYGVVAYLVSQRTRELAVRMALGADGGRILRLVLSDALRPAAFGIVLGLAGAALGARLLESLLYGIKAHDAVTFIAAPLLLLAVALLASLAPALRAARLEPRVALDED